LAAATERVQSDAEPEEVPDQAGDDAGGDGQVGQLRRSFFLWRAEVLEVAESEEPESEVKLVVIFLKP
jgi:hypothetical protein